MTSQSALSYYERNKDRSREYSARNADRRKAQKRARSLANKEYIAQQKGFPCVDCGGSFHYSAMDFHHVDPNTKVAEVSQMHDRYSRAKITEEISKCELLCANCHRIRHWRSEHPD